MRQIFDCRIHAGQPYNESLTLEKMARDAWGLPLNVQPFVDPPMHRAIIDNLLEIRKNHAFGEQNYYFDHPNTIGFTRVGDEEHPHSGVAVLISNGEDGDKVMNVGKQHAGETWKEATGSRMIPQHRLTASTSLRTRKRKLSDSIVER